MAPSSASTARSYAFDDRNIRWRKFEGLENFVGYVFDVDEKRNVVDFILKFDANKRIFLHRHLALTNTFVVHGEHRLYEPNGDLKEIRRVGSYTVSPPASPHTEGGGDEGCVVLYSVRPDGDGIFEVLDDNLNVVGVLTVRDFQNAMEEQKKA